MSWLLSYSGKELHNIFSFLPILYHYIPFISRITIHLSHVSSVRHTLINRYYYVRQNDDRRSPDCDVSPHDESDSPSCDDGLFLQRL